jgi:hypothetical protein
MEKIISPYSLTVAKEEKEKINLQNQETWYGETLTLKTQFTRKKFIKNDGSPLSPVICRKSKGGKGTSGGGNGSGAELET